MSIVNTTRASYQKMPNIPGYGKRNKPKRVSSPSEDYSLDNAITALRRAKLATNEGEFLRLISEAFKISRNLFRSRQNL